MLVNIGGSFMINKSFRQGKYTGWLPSVVNYSFNFKSIVNPESVSGNRYFVEIYNTKSVYTHIMHVGLHQEVCFSKGQR